VTSGPNSLGSAVNKFFGEPVPEIAIDERDGNTPDDAVEHDTWLRGMFRRTTVELRLCAKREKRPAICCR
jgi:hypothetical protein